MNSDLSKKLSSAAVFCKRGEFDRAYPIYSELAQSGHLDSQVFLGWMLWEGKGAKINKAQAAQWFERSAQTGSMSGAFYFARFLTTDGKHSESIHWYKQAADGGYSPALFRLGLAYAKGKGVDINIRLAYKYLKASTEEGHVFALREIALLDIKGNRGFKFRLYGVLELCSAFATGIYFGIVDSQSDKLRG